MSGMAREEAIKHLEDMKKGLFLWDMDELIDLCISALSTEGEYIKKSELLDKTIRRNSIWNEVTNSEGKGLEEIVNDLPTYSFPGSSEEDKKIGDLTLRELKEMGVTVYTSPSLTNI